MPSFRLSRAFSKSGTSDKEKEAEAEVHRNRSHSDSPPPSYAAQDVDQDNAIEPPNLTAGFSNLSLGTKGEHGFPTTNECIAHLKLLEGFYRLRQKIGSSDGLFGLHNAIVARQELSSEEESKQLVKLASKRWSIYISRAVVRFEKWIETCSYSTGPITKSRLRIGAEAGDLCDSPTKGLSMEVLPPLDVLMVWHAYMLNPRAYFEDCLRMGRMALWHTPMPWQEAADSIDPDTFEYQAGDENIAAFTERTGLSWHNLDDHDKKALRCWSCNEILTVSWTSPSRDVASLDKVSFDSARLSELLDDYLATGTGYCDDNFSAQCPSCNATVNRDRVEANKFLSDCQLLLEKNVPMRGSLFGMEGIPSKVGIYKDRTFKEMHEFPTILIEKGLGLQLIRSNNQAVNGSMEAIRNAIEIAIKDKGYMRAVRATRGYLYLHERVVIRRMMSRYWGNSSPFALDLVGACIRQGTFIEKMHHIDWLHSPALPSTMSRLCTKYSRFMTLMMDKTHMAVPTLDVDLAWHTHQLTPDGYMRYSLSQTSQFIDHDDKVAEAKLNDAFAWTSKTYAARFGEPYSECTCWYCEAVRESHTSAASRLFNRRRAPASNMLHGAEHGDPRKSVHISSHSAVPVRDEPPEYQRMAQKQAADLERAYKKACDRARKQGRKEPKREMYYYSEAYGYPVYVPMYMPYFYGGYGYGYGYSYGAGCMALGAGAAGNCCAGTCGGGVAAGGCASVGAGGCAGGAAGGFGGGMGGACAGSGAAAGCAGGVGGGCGGGGGF